jgi:hypothetical protein
MMTSIDWSFWQPVLTFGLCIFIPVGFSLGASFAVFAAGSGYADD